MFPSIQLQESVTESGELQGIVREALSWCFWHISAELCWSAFPELRIMYIKFCMRDFGAGCGKRQRRTGFLSTGTVPKFSVSSARCCQGTELADMFVSLRSEICHPWGPWTRKGEEVWVGWEPEQWAMEGFPILGASSTWEERAQLPTALSSVPVIPVLSGQQRV